MKGHQYQQECGLVKIFLADSLNLLNTSILQVSSICLVRLGEPFSSLFHIKHRNFLESLGGVYPARAKGAVAPLGHTVGRTSSLRFRTLLGPSSILRTYLLLGSEPDLSHLGSHASLCCQMSPNVLSEYRQSAWGSYTCLFCASRS